MKCMRSGIVLLIGILIALSSCTDEQNPAKQYGNTMAQTHKNAKTFDNKVNVQQVQKSIQEFYAANNRYPSDLNELSAFNGITLRGNNYDYDSTTGLLTEK
jgi:hypothetical protein